MGMLVLVAFLLFSDQKAYRTYGFRSSTLVEKA
jgi:hypothetical protein